MPKQEILVVAETPHPVAVAEYNVPSLEEKNALFLVVRTAVCHRCRFLVAEIFRGTAFFTLVNDLR